MYTDLRSRYLEAYFVRKIKYIFYFIKIYYFWIYKFSYKIQKNVQRGEIPSWKENFSAITITRWRMSLSYRGIARDSRFLLLALATLLLYFSRVQIAVFFISKLHPFYAVYHPLNDYTSKSRWNCTEFPFLMIIVAWRIYNARLKKTPFPLIVSHLRE